MSWSIWLVPSSVWVGEVWSKHGLKWMQECAFTCWRLISPLWFLRKSATGCKWEKLAPLIFYYYYYFYLFIYFYGLDPTMILRINIPKIIRLIQYLFDFCSKSFTFSMRYSSSELIQWRGFVVLLTWNKTSSINLFYKQFWQGALTHAIVL